MRFTRTIDAFRHETITRKGDFLSLEEANMATLRLIFHGLLGFVLYKDQGEDIVSVLFPSQPLPQQAYGADPFISESHYPFLRFAKTLLDGHSLRVPQYEVAVSGGPPDYILFLQGERLSIPNLGGGIVPVYDATIPPTAEKPSPVPAEFDRQKKDFRWAAHMDDAIKGSGLADGDPLDKNELQLVEAVFDVRKGNLGCYSLCDECILPSGMKDASTFKLAAKAQLQALSETIFIEVDVASQLALQSNPLPNSTGMPQQNLLLNADGSGLIECHVFNSELDVIIKPPSLPFQVKDPRDFVQLFELSNKRPPIGSRTAPRIVRASGGASPAGDHICPAGVFHV
jgi:hypothetical protein